jgi:hypothetical protein
MAVSGTPTSLQSILSQIQTAKPAATAPVARPASDPAAPVSQQRAAAEPRVNLPPGSTSLDPNAPRGTYLNLKV